MAVTNQKKKNELNLLIVCYKTVCGLWKEKGSQKAGFLFK